MNLNGIYIVKKPVGMTSYDVVRYFKKLCHTSKVGHAGSLDPFASGLLIIGVNEGTKILQFLENDVKEYIAELTLGKETDTLDTEGKVIKEKKVNKHSKEEVEKVLKSFIGEYTQIPPKYSALKVNGKCLYEYARQGKEISIKSRLQHIYDIKLILLDKNKITFYVKCDKGTYIRVLGKDISNKINELGYLTNLERIRIGKHYILNVKKPECIDVKDIIKIEDALDMKKVEVQDLKKIKNGNPIKLNIKEENILMMYKTTPLAVYSYSKDDKLYHCKRGFNYEDNKD